MKKIPETSFYHLTSSPLGKALPKLLEKVIDTGERAVVFTRDEEQTDLLNTLLWTYTTIRFLPHGSHKDGDAEMQPIFLTADMSENPNGAKFAAMVNGAEVQDKSGFSRVLDIFDGNNAGELAAARVRWKSYKNKGFLLSYFKQDEKGKWEKQDIA